MLSPTLAFLSPSNHVGNVDRFLKSVDRVTGVMGLNVSPIVNIAQLRSLPVGSFGRAWADFLDRNRLSPLTTGARRKQLHDGVHVLTGYGTDAIGEAEVQAFLLGSKFMLVHIVLLAALMRRIGREVSLSGQGEKAIEARLKAAYNRGCESNFDADTWQPELLWEVSLAEVRQLFLI
ncbi:Coq4 family protein [Tumidithrix elongata RA019]|uniref:Coq4 family protein n=1 Tax=Tumidithrix elongata BACA0141 TaxID=2716417 RepID=A0AAW9Q2A1_9CYAN|nr:Coq4 family protein [Tumidithrix elongata RA019]